MNKKIKIVIILTLISFVIIIFFLLSSGSRSNVSNSQLNKNQEQLLAVYQNYCSRCHGMPDDGNKVFSAENYSIEEIRELIYNGGSYMPGFQNIKEPVLTELARFVQNL